MKLEEWRELCGKWVIDEAGSEFKVIGLITDPAVILQNVLGRTSTVVIGSIVGAEFKPDRRGGNGRRRSEN